MSEEKGAQPRSGARGPATDSTQMWIESRIDIFNSISRSCAAASRLPKQASTMYLYDTLYTVFFEGWLLIVDFKLLHMVVLLVIIDYYTV